MKFEMIKGFAKYETNGKQIKNVKTGNIMAVKAGTDKFQLTNDDGKRKALTMVQIKGMMKLLKKEPVLKIVKGAGKTAPAATKPAATKAAPAVKKVSKKAQILELKGKGLTAHEIAKKTGFSYNTISVTIKVDTILAAHAKGLKPAAIAKETGYKLSTVMNEIPKKK